MSLGNFLPNITWQCLILVPITIFIYLFCHYELEFFIIHVSFIPVSFALGIKSVSIENSVLVPLENSNYVLFHEPTRHCFRYKHHTIQLSQVRYDDCNWSMRYLWCQDDILHQMMGANIRQIKTPDYINGTDKVYMYP